MLDPTAWMPAAHAPHGPPLARGLLAGYARASALPSETVQALRELTRARRDLIQSRTAARQRLQDRAQR